MNTNPLKELERKLEDAHKALELSLEKDSGEKAKLEKAIAALEMKIAPLSKRLRELREKSLPFNDNISYIEKEIISANSKMIGPWVIDGHDALLYYHNSKREWYNRVVWFRGVCNGYPTYKRTWTASIRGSEDVMFEGGISDKVMRSHFLAIEERCKELGYFILNEV